MANELNAGFNLPYSSLSDFGSQSVVNNPSMSQPGYTSTVAAGALSTSAAIQASVSGLTCRNLQQAARSGSTQCIDKNGVCSPPINNTCKTGTSKLFL